MAKNDDFWEAYRDPRWQKRRLEVMDRAGWTCKMCGTETETLHVHHAYYKRGKMPWEYPDDSLFCWCESCHERFSSLKRNIDLAICSLSLGNFSKFLDFLGDLYVANAKENEAVEAITE